MSRTRTIKFRVTPEEKTCIQATALAQGQTVTDFLRQRALVLSLAANITGKRTDTSLGTHSAKLNQLARWVNTHKSRAATACVAAQAFRL